MIQVAIADDHKLFRKGIHMLIDDLDGIKMVFEAEHGQALLDMLPQHEVDLVFLDLEMPVLDGIKTLPLLRERFPQLKIIILSMHNDDQMITHLMEKGAHGYLLKDAEPEEVEQAIRTTMTAGHYFNERISKAMLAALKYKQKPKLSFQPANDLTARELEILSLICQEFTSLEIADRLFISKRTVEGHRNRLLEKTGAKNTAGLVVFAMKNGLMG